MKYIIILLLLVSCSQPVTFEIRSGSSYVKEADITQNGKLLNFGKLPLEVTADDNDEIQAEFEAHATNFAGNHPECNCEKISINLYRCVQTKKVDGKDWVIAKK